MALIPVVLEFSGVAKDSSLSLTLATEGAKWSIGNAEACKSEGFSYNGFLLGETRPSCLASIELTDSVIGIRTSLSASATSFTLTLFMDVQQEVESVQGYCTLNAGANVTCSLGYGVEAEWGSGRFSSIVRPLPNDARRVRFNIQRAPVGVAITIHLMADPSQGDAYWCFDVGAADASGLILRAAKGLPLPLKTCSITDRQIVVIPGGNQKIASDMFIEAYLRRTIASSQARSTADPPSKKLTRFYLRATCDPSTVVVAQVGVQPPQYLAASYSCFDF